MKSDLKAAKASGLPVFAGYVVYDFGEALAFLLQKHLSERYSSVNVYKGNPCEAPAFIVNPSLSYTPLVKGTHMVDVKLMAGNGLGSPLEATGSAKVRANPGHIAWLVTVVLVHGVILGFPIGFSIAGAMHDSYRETTFALAMDQAAENLADQLVITSTSPPPPPPAVEPQSDNENHVSDTPAVEKPKKKKSKKATK